MIKEKRYSSFWDNVGGSILFLWLGVPLIGGLVVAFFEVGRYLIETNITATIVVPYIIIKVLTIALTIVIPFNIVRRLVRRFGWPVTVAVVACVLVAGAILFEGVSYKNYVNSLDEEQRSEMSAFRKTVGYAKTKSLTARRQARKEEKSIFLHDYRLVKSRDAKKLVAERYFAGVMLRDLDWITGNKLHMAENFLRETEYDIDELVRASETEGEAIPK